RTQTTTHLSSGRNARWARARSSQEWTTKPVVVPCTPPANDCRRALRKLFATARSPSEPKMDTESYILPVREVIRETADACSVVFDIADDVRDRFDYKPGQFLTVAVPSDQTGLAARCYSLSSSPVLDQPLAITVKRTVDGYASNWIC